MTIESEVEIEGDYDPLQKELMKETIVLVDENDKVTGWSSKKACHLNENIEKGLLHRAFSVFLFNEKNELLLQQRASSKITFPMMWTNTCCSHMLHSNDEIDPVNQIGAKRAAQRKLYQELGIVAEELPLDSFSFITKIHYKAASDKIWGEHEIDYIIFIKRNVTVNINENECNDFQYISKSDLQDLIRKAESGEDGISITPWFALIAKKLLFKWWDSLDNIKAIQDPNVIHRFL